MCAYSGNYIRDGDYKNIIGRIGRALIDTEGKIFLIRPPECYTDDDWKSLTRLVFPERIETPLKSTLDDIIPSDVETIINCVEDIEQDTILKLKELTSNILSRIQVFIFSVYEITPYETFEEFWHQYKSCFFINVNKESSLFLTTSSRTYFNLAAKVNFDFLSKCNKTGLSYASNLKLSDIASEIPISLDIREIISENIFNNIINCKEFKPDNTSVNHYAIFNSWISGKSYYAIRERYFAQADKEEATQNVQRISEICFNINCHGHSVLYLSSVIVQ